MKMRKEDRKTEGKHYHIYFDNYLSNLMNLVAILRHVINLECTQVSLNQVGESEERTIWVSKEETKKSRNL